LLLKKTNIWTGPARARDVRVLLPPAGISHFAFVGRAGSIVDENLTSWDNQGRCPQAPPRIEIQMPLSD